LGSAGQHPASAIQLNEICQVVFQMAEVAVQRELFRAILDWAAEIARSGIRMKGKVKGVA